MTSCTLTCSATERAPGSRPSTAEEGLPRPPLVCDPGDRWEYGISTDWVGQAVERLSGQSLEDYFREHIFAPLGMHDTGFVLRPEQRARLAARPRAPARRLAPGRPVRGAARAGVLQRRGRSVLDRARLPALPAHAARRRPARRRAVHRPETVDHDGREPDRGADGGVYRCRVSTTSILPGMVKKWGLGAMITTAGDTDRPRRRQLAWAGAFNTFFWIDPARRVTGVFLTQIRPFATAASSTCSRSSSAPSTRAAPSGNSPCV